MAVVGLVFVKDVAVVKGICVSVCPYSDHLNSFIGTR